MSDTLAHWLKSTIPGIVLLGAAGSLAALVALRLLRLLLARLVRPAIREMLVRFLASILRTNYMFGYLRGYVQGTNDWALTISLAAFRLLQCQVALAAITISVVIAVVVAITAQASFRYAVIFVCSVLFFVASYALFEAALHIWLDHFNVVRPIFKRAAASADTPKASSGE